MSNTNTYYSPSRRIKHLPIVSPHHTAAVSSTQYSSDDDTNASSTTDSSMAIPDSKYNTTDTNTDKIKESSSRQTRLSHMLFGKFALWGIFLAAILSVLSAAMFTSSPPNQVWNKSSEGSTTSSSTSTEVSIYIDDTSTTSFVNE